MPSDIGLPQTTTEFCDHLFDTKAEQAIFEKKKRKKAEDYLEPKGLEVTEDYVDNEFFRQCKLPAGWKIDSTELSIHVRLKWKVYDEKGNPRIYCWFDNNIESNGNGLTFHDNDEEKDKCNYPNSCARLIRRYEIEASVSGEEDNKTQIATVIDNRDGGKVIFTESGKYESGMFSINPVDKAERWLKENYPKCNDATAYWDD